MRKIVNPVGISHGSLYPVRKSGKRFLMPSLCSQTKCSYGVKLASSLLVTITILSILTLSCHKKEVTAKAVRIGYLQNDLHQLAVFVALEKNFYKSGGVDVEVAGIFRAGPEEMTAFSAGELDIGYVGEAPSTTAVANKTADVKAIAQVNKEGSAIVVKKGSRIFKLRDMIGKTIAIPGHSTVQDFLLRKALKTYAIDENAVNIIVIKPPEMIVSLKLDQIDAFIAWEPYIAKAITLGVGRLLLPSSNIWGHHPCCVLIADSKFMRDNPAAVRKVLLAHIKATNFIKRNPLEATQIGMKFTGMDKDTVRMAMGNIEFDYNLSYDGEIEYVSFLNKVGYIKVDDPKLFTDSFIDSTLLDEIKLKIEGNN